MPQVRKENYHTYSKKLLIEWQQLTTIINNGAVNSRQMRFFL